MPSVVIFHTNQHIFPNCTLTHMTDLMTYPYTTSQISLKSQCVFRPSHNMVRSTEERFAHGDPRLRRQENRDHAGLAAIDNEAVVAEAALGRRRATSGDRTVVGLCVMSFCMFRLTSRGVSCVPPVCRSMAVIRSAFVPQRSSTPGFLLGHVAQSLVSANVCRRLTSSAAAAASRST